MKTNLVKLATTAAVATLMIVPSLSFADGHRSRQDRNQWNNIAIGSGALGVIGLLGHNDTLATLGLLGAGYSAYRANTVSDNCNTWDQHSYRYDGGGNYGNRYNGGDQYSGYRNNGDRYSGGYRNDRQSRDRSSHRQDNGNRSGWQRGQG